jgi:deoxyribose-phosphate aldolase
MRAMNITREQLAGMIDHAVLSPTAGPEDLRAGCDLCVRTNVLSICVRPADVAETVAILGDSKVMVGTVIGFPHGATHPGIKAAETAQAVTDGAEEIDMVLNIGRLLAGQNDYVRDEIARVVEAAEGRPVKVILECCYLGREEIIAGCEATRAGGAQFVKTSTGFGSGGATVEDVRLMRERVGEAFGVKASGGIRSLADAVAMIQAGADRLGTSRTEQMLEEIEAS